MFPHPQKQEAQHTIQEATEGGTRVGLEAEGVRRKRGQEP